MRFGKHFPVLSRLPGAGAGPPHRYRGGHKHQRCRGQVREDGPLFQAGQRRAVLFQRHGYTGKNFLQRQVKSEEKTLLEKLTHLLFERIMSVS